MHTQILYVLNYTNTNRCIYINKVTIPSKNEFTLRTSLAWMRVMPYACDKDTVQHITLSRKSFASGPMFEWWSLRI